MTMMRLGAALMLAAPLGPLAAQDMPAMDHSAHTPPPNPETAEQPPMPMDHAAMGHDMAGMDDGAMDQGMMMMAPNGAVTGSGTSRLPAGDMMKGLHFMAGDWALMAHGYVWGVSTDQGGPRGDSKAFVESMAMLEASRPLGDGVRLGVRTMLSLEPLMSHRGYPNLFATGEAANGQPLIDRQHPHDLFMELSARIDVDVAPETSLFVYGGPVAEPALGPSAFMHRASARLNPDAPITHHWFDSTHITYGVVTAGVSARKFQLELSAFRGREPDEFRWNIETPKLDSWSARASWQPVPWLVGQVSHGRLKEPEELHPGEDEARTTASLSYVRGGVAITAGYARKNRLPGRALDAWLAEGTWDITQRHAVFGRYENVENDELFGEGDPLHDRAVRVAKATLGYAYTVPLGGTFNVAFGASASVYGKPAALDPAYGRNPVSGTVFAKLSLGRF